MRVLLTGASGLLGRAIVRRFESSHELLATAFSRSEPPLHRLDLRCKEDVQALARKFRPRLIIHSAAERRPDICENDHGRTDALNIAAVKTLADCAKEVGAALIYLSTDYVFDGTAAPYGVDARTNPLNYYGTSKRAGELAALGSEAAVCVLRVPILYGPVETLAESPVTAIARLLEGSGECAVDHWAIRYPTHVDDVAAAIHGLAELLEMGMDLPRILHFTGDEPFTKFEMARIMADVLGRDAAHLRPEGARTGGAPRPYNCRLDDSLLMALVPVAKRSFRAEIGGLVRPNR